MAMATDNERDRMDIQNETLWKTPFDFQLSYAGSDGSVYIALLEGLDQDFGVRRKFLAYRREWVSRDYYSQVFNFKLYPGQVIEEGIKQSPNKSYYVCSPQGKLVRICRTSQQYDGTAARLIRDYLSGRIPLEIILKQ